MTEDTVECVADVRNTLGEGPCWSSAEQRLYWFDIKQAKLFWYETKSGQVGRFDLPVRASAAAPLSAGGLLCATEAGLARIDTTTSLLTPVQPVDLGPGFRSNEGKIDVAGRFWWSRMDEDGGARPGDVFRTDPDGATHVVLEGVHIPNSLACSPGGDLLYVADSRHQVMLAHPILADGLLGEGLPFFDTTGGEATPDGSAIDAEGYLWNAQWGGWRIARYAPDGTLERVVQTPVAQPSSCAFGGPDLDILFVTSARDGLSASDLAAQPRAGGLFAFRPGVQGLPLPAFKGFAAP